MKTTGDTVVYGRQIGGQPVRLTVRIDWFADGSIVPRMYRTPDGSRYEVRHVYEVIPLALLNDVGAGLRFRVLSELTETPGFSDELLHTRHETYLYLCDKKFCKKSLLDESYGHGEKDYISVTLDVNSGGDYELAYFWVKGNRYKVEKSLAIEPHGCFHAGGVGIRHRVETRLVGFDDDEDPDPGKSIRRQAAVYLEINRWFVSVTTVR